MFSSYVLYDTVAIEAVYFPQPSPAATTTITACTSGTERRAVDDDAPYALPLRETLLHRLTERYVGRIIPSRGLCVAITDVMDYSASSVRGAAASAWLTATFGVCVFAPAVGTRLKARIAHQSAAGIYLTLDLFVAIPFLVPAALLVPGSRYHAAQRSWYLPLDEQEKAEGGDAAAVDAGEDRGTASSGSAAPTVAHNKYLVGAEVVVKVASCTVLSEDAVVAAEEATSAEVGISGFGGGSSLLSFATTLPSTSVGVADGGESPLAIMELRGSFVGDALGPVSWFEDA